MIGRLYWKFFLFFFLAQLTTAFGVGVFILFDIERQSHNVRIDHSPIAQSFISAAISTLELGGESALKQLLHRWQDDHIAEQLFVLRQDGTELLSRNVDTIFANDEKDKEEIHSQTPKLTKIKLTNGSEYRLFVIAPSARFIRHREVDVDMLPPGAQGQATLDAIDHPPHHADMPHENGWLRLVSTFPIKPILIGALASILFAAILAWYFLKPIKSLRRAFEQVANGDLDVRVAERMSHRNDELSDLGHHFDYMVERISALMQMQRRLLHHVSHELRSPLARIYMALGLATQNKDRAESSFNRIELEANRMEKLIGELLELSRLESGMTEIRKESFLLNDVLETIVDDALLEASAKRMKIQLNIASLIFVIGQQDLLHRAIENVVRNAIKYGPNDSQVNVNCQYLDDKKWVEIEVQDQGGGVLETELADIFKPFIRGHSGSQNIGHGVGLAITQQVIEAHSGVVSARNIKPFGFAVSIKIPTT
jgi:two-component system, OmpR family, sensor kinase